MLERTDRRFLLMLVGFFVAHPDVLNQEMERRLLSDLNGPLDFIHGRDAMPLLDARRY